MPPRIELKGARPLVSGTYRYVYQHPLDERLLIKVVKPEAAEKLVRRAGWYRARFGNGHYRSMQREVGEYAALRRRGLHELPFLQRFEGIVETDLGPGMAVAKVRGRDGDLAPTLSALVKRHGLSAPLREGIAALQAEVIRHHIVFGDISGSNIVAAHDPERGDRLVIVDGLSDQLWLPVNSLSRTFYRIYCNRRFARALAYLEALDRGRGAGAAAAS